MVSVSPCLIPTATLRGMTFGLAVEAKNTESPCCAWGPLSTRIVNGPSAEIDLEKSGPETDSATVSTATQ
jgi:hypothetical protein